MGCIEAAAQAQRVGGYATGVDVVFRFDLRRDAPSSGKRLPGGSRAVPVYLALGDDEKCTPELIACFSAALRADSPDAPATHAEALARGDVWCGPDTSAESVELNNHKANASWDVIRRCDVPKGRRIHKLI